MNNTILALDALLTRYVNLYSEHHPALPYVTFENSWPSECVVKQGERQGCYYWKPVRRNQAIRFDDMEAALEIKFPAEIHAFYGTFWSNGICVERHDINFNLIQVWNEEDEQMLKENILGHMFARIRAKLPLSYFIGSTHGEDIICLDHDSRQIILEKPGFRGHKVLADTLENFLISLQPTTDSYSV
jgi:SecY interacting protein Syd